MQKVTLTRRTRKFGIGWTNDVEQDEQGNLRVRAVDEPDFEGTIAECARYYWDALNCNRANDWRVAAFYDGKRIVFEERDELRHLFAYFDEEPGRASYDVAIEGED